MKTLRVTFVEEMRVRCSDEDAATYLQPADYMTVYEAADDWRGIAHGDLQHIESDVHVALDDNDFTDLVPIDNGADPSYLDLAHYYLMRAEYALGKAEYRQGAISEVRAAKRDLQQLALRVVGQVRG